MTQTKVMAAIFGLLLTFMAGAWAQEKVSATEVPSAANDKSARVTVLDKQTNRLQTLVLVAGQMQTVGSLDIKLTKCLPDYAAQLGQDVAWLDIEESANGSGSGTSWFSGWMFNTYPEVSTLDHPRYDVILQGCGTKARKTIQTLGSAPVLDTAPVVDTETSADPTGSAGSDPYAVPGVRDASPAAKPEEAAPAEQPVDTEAAPAEPAAQQEVPSNAAPIAQPVEPTPPAQPQPSAQEQKQDLHELMDSGTY
ncbi:MAG: DUF2155 domain-containing protein [Blastochloris viridis]|uniref:DUF2155 domain-containing protein n=1 Tax=Blastochloris viridis TaxID=1079 RepID=A0A6N4RCW8_BLAVI|nr:MAG: DUF2155 domain-containing protein [Blastochloris viridis]